MALRVFAIPIAGPRCAYFAVNPTSKSLLDGWSASAAPGSFKSKCLALAQRVQQKGMDEWKEMESAPPTTLKRKTATFINKHLDKVNPLESFLKEVSVSESVQLVFPSNLNATEVTENLRRLVETELPLQRRWTFINLGLLPVSTLCGILPGPNIFLVYNAFRLYSRWRAWKGAQFLRRVFSPPLLDAPSSPSSSVAVSTTIAGNESISITHEPHVELSNLLAADTSSETVAGTTERIISLETIDKISVLFNNHELKHQLIRSRNAFAES